jgi:hypothetical protein
VDPVVGEELGDTIVGVLVGGWEEPRDPVDRGILVGIDCFLIILILLNEVLVE